MQRQARSCTLRQARADKHAQTSTIRQARTDKHAETRTLRSARTDKHTYTQASTDKHSETSTHGPYTQASTRRPASTDQQYPSQPVPTKILVGLLSTDPGHSCRFFCVSRRFVSFRTLAGFVSFRTLAVASLLLGQPAIHVSFVRNFSCASESYFRVSSSPSVEGCY